MDPSDLILDTEALITFGQLLASTQQHTVTLWYCEEGSVQCCRNSFACLKNIKCHSAGKYCPTEYSLEIDVIDS